jgi:APA family basic amino acid/polyamine antiporter
MSTTKEDIKKDIVKGVEDATDDLKKVLTFKDLVFFGLGNIVGSGIFVILGKTILYGGRYTIPAFVVISILSIIMGYMYIEIYSRYESETMEYESIRENLGQKMGDVSMYLIYMFAVFSSITIITSISKYLCSYGIMGEYFETHKMFQIMFSITLLCVIAFVNYLGIDKSKMVANSIGILMVLLLTGVVVSSIPSFDFSKIVNGPKAPMNSYVLATIVAIFLYTGYDMIVKMRRETINPEDTKSAMTTTIVFTTIIYLLVAISCICVLGYSSTTHTYHPLTKIYEVIYGKRVAIITFIIGAFIMFNTAFLSQISATRFMYGCAVRKDCQYHDIWSKLSANKTPINAILFTLVLSIIGVIFHNEVLMAIFSNFTTLAVMLAMSISLVLIRWKERHEPDEKNNYFPLNIKNVPLPLLAGIGILIFFTVTIVKNKFFI